MPTADPRDASFVGNEYRANFKDVIAKRSDLARFDGGRLIYPAAGQTQQLYAGQVLGQVTTAGPNFGRWAPVAAGATDGTQTAAGVLKKSTVVDEFGNGSEIAIIKGGTLFKDLLIGLNAAAITALNGSVSVEHGVNLIHISV